MARAPIAAQVTVPPPPPPAPVPADKNAAQKRQRGGVYRERNLMVQHLISKGCGKKAAKTKAWADWKPAEYSQTAEAGCLLLK